MDNERVILHSDMNSFYASVEMMSTQSSKENLSRCADRLKNVMVSSWSNQTWPRKPE